MSSISEKTKVDNCSRELFKEIFTEYQNNSYKIILSRGYSNENKDYTAAKKPIETGWQNSPGKSFKEAEEHFYRGGWISAVLPNNLIVLDIDKSEAKKETDEDLENKLKKVYEILDFHGIRDQVGIHKTNNGYHFIFMLRKEEIGTISGATHDAKCGIPITYRTNKNNIILAPSNKRSWVKFVSNDKLAYLPTELQPEVREVHAQDSKKINTDYQLQEDDIFSKIPPDKVAGAKEQGAALGELINKAWLDGTLSGNDDIDLPFLSFLVVNCCHDKTSVLNMFKHCYRDKFDEKHTTDLYNRLQTIKNGPHKAAGTWFKTLKDKNLNDIIDACRAYDKYFEEEYWKNYQPKMKILGFNPDQPKEIYHYFAGKIRTIKIDELTPESYTAFTNDDIDDKFYKNIIKKKIVKTAIECGPIERNTSNLRRTGFYKSGDALYFNFGKTVWVGRYNSVGVIEFTDDISNHPIIDDVEEETRLYFETSKNFINPSRLKDFSAVTLKEVFSELRELFGCWEFGTSRQGFNELDFFTAFMLLLPFNDFLDWRPILFLQGPSGTGKTHLLDNIICQIYSGLVERIQDPTPFSIIQKFSNSRRIPILDEFEQIDDKKDNRKRILSYLYNVGKGGTVTRGTTNDETKDFYLKTLPILSAITIPNDVRSATQNRLIEFTLAKKNKDTSVINNDLGYKIIACLLNNFPQIEALANSDDYKTTDASNRHINNYKYARAVIELATGIRATLPEDATKDVRDEIKLIDKLKDLDITYTADGLTKHTKLVQLIEAVYVEQGDGHMELLDAKAKLLPNWLTFTNKGGVDCLAIHPTMFSGTTFKKAYPNYAYHFAKILDRVPGLTKTKVRFIGEKNAINCPAIPIEIFTGILNKTAAE